MRDWATSDELTLRQFNEGQWEQDANDLAQRAESFAVLHIGLGLWSAGELAPPGQEDWFAGGGITWAASIAARHRWPVVRQGFNHIVKPHPRLMAYLVAYAEMALGLGLIVGFLSPIALVGGTVLSRRGHIYLSRFSC